MSFSKMALIVLIVTLLVVAYVFDVHHLLTLENLKSNREALSSYYAQNTILFILLYFAIYVGSTALSLPGATILTLAGGFIFGPLLGSVIVIFAATTGSTLAFLTARFILRKSLENKYATTIQKFNDGLNNNAWSYLLFLRLVPAFPFFLINLVMGLTRLPIYIFIMGSLFGMYPGTFVYTYAGSQLATIESLSDIASPQVLGAFTLLGLFALIPTLIKRFKHRKGAPREV